MKAMNKFAYLCGSCFAAVLLSGCSYNELPPKTGDASETYVLPSGELPTAEERAAMQAARDEYEDYLTEHK